MKIKNINLQNFKRFSDLTISDIPETSKLVLLIGSNGSGKSCLFDAFDWLSKGSADDYYRKNSDKEPLAEVSFYDSDYWIKRVGKKYASVGVIGSVLTSSKMENQDDMSKASEVAKKFIGRSSIRIVPKILTKGDRSQIFSNQDRPENYAENDTRFVNDVFEFIEQFNEHVRELIFSRQKVDSSQILKEFIEPLNSSLLAIFGDDESTTIQCAQIQGGEMPGAPEKPVFRKGSSEITYDLLSHGEKQVVILLMNFIIRQKSYENSIIFIDEMDCHLNTTLQYALLEEIVNRWIPDSSQLWTASHALGFIDYARNSDDASIIDFDLLNFDQEQKLQPVSKNNLEVYNVAVPRETLTSVLNGRKLVLVENKNDKLFNESFCQENEFLFAGVQDSAEVFLRASRNNEIIGLRDKDYLRDDESLLIQKQCPNLKILRFYTFENYIYHPDNIAELGLDGFNKDAYRTEILAQKNANRDSIISQVAISRQHYIEFKNLEKEFAKQNLSKIDIDPIIKALQSDDFDIFYPFFNMKGDKFFIKKLNLKPSDLVKTSWFKTQIKAILNS